MRPSWLAAADPKSEEDKEPPLIISIRTPRKALIPHGIRRIPASVAPITQEASTSSVARLSLSLPHTIAEPRATGPSCNRFPTSQEHR
jgi:hypothetical protein